VQGTKQPCTVVLIAKVAELLERNYGVIGEKSLRMFGTRVTDRQRDETITKAGTGQLDVVVCSQNVAKYGCNMQGCNWIVALNPMAMATDETQALGRPIARSR
jgi:hypothetical protein